MSRSSEFVTRARRTNKNERVIAIPKPYGMQLPDGASFRWEVTPDGFALHYLTGPRPTPDPIPWISNT